MTKFGIKRAEEESDRGVGFIKRYCHYDAPFFFIFRLRELSIKSRDYVVSTSIV